MLNYCGLHDRNRPYAKDIVTVKTMIGTREWGFFRRRHRIGEYFLDVCPCERLTSFINKKYWKRWGDCEQDMGSGGSLYILPYIGFTDSL